MNFYRHEMNRHPKRLTEKAKKCEAAFLYNRPDIIRVISPSGRKYFVRLMASGSSDAIELDCSCDFCRKYANQDRACSHKIAATMKLERDFGHYTSYWADKKDAIRQHRIIIRIQDLYATVKKI